MASIIVFLLLPAFLMTAAQQQQSNIPLGSSLTPTTNPTWLSPSGLYAFGFYKQGNGYAVGIFLAGIPQKTVVWTANRDDPPVSSDYTLLLTRDGRGLVLKMTDGQETYVANSSQSASSASLSDSGNFVLYNSDQEKIWQSFDHPTDTLLPGQPLLTGAQMFSSVSEVDQSTGIFSLAMQGDGNLVQYLDETPRTTQSAYWATGTDGWGDNVTLNFDADGHLYLLNATGNNNILNLTAGGYPTEETIYLMRIDAGGFLGLYSHNLTNNGNWSIVWNPRYDKCTPKGLCGLNGYCVLNGQNAECRCLPGFAKVKEGDWTSGCKRDFNAGSCKSNVGYTIQTVSNTIWEDDSYFVLSLSSVEDCKTACLEDCICEVAMFKYGECKKQKLPLKYGRGSSDSNIALVKVRTSNSTEEPKLELNKRKKNDKKGILIISVSLIAFAFILLAISGVLTHRNHVWAYKKLSRNGNNRLIEDVAPISFTYAELEKVTDNFKVQIGRGAFGTVYKGEILNGEKAVAVKRLDKVSTEGEREFLTELKIIGRTHHRNLVRLLGYCLDGANRLLVYEYMSNGSLADVLFTPEKQPCWNARTEIVRNIARGLLYLHEECETQIIHCDIKPQNILMDEHCCASISDFGLAKLLKADQTKTYTGIRGTRGYVAPEWHKKLPVTVKVDVYSFGIVLLEIICCRRSVNWSLPEEEAILEEWVEECFKVGDLGKLVGDEEVDKRQLERMVKVGLWCILEEPSLRPSMKKVLLMLEGTVDIPIPPSATSFFSAI